MEQSYIYPKTERKVNMLCISWGVELHHQAKFALEPMQNLHTTKERRTIKKQPKENA